MLVGSCMNTSLMLLLGSDASASFGAVPGRFEACGTATVPREDMNSGEELNLPV